MIKNIIFDMGEVLLHYTPRKHLQSFGFDDDKIEELLKNVFNSSEWKELDRGTYTFKEAIAKFSQDNPDLKEEIALTLNETFDHMLSLKEETSDFLKQLKADGYKIYILSNFPIECYKYVTEKFDYFNFVDGQIISGYVKMIKPNKDIYEYMIKKLNILPSESIFIDDLQSNLDSAAFFGIKTVLFDKIDNVKEKVQALIDEK